MFIALCTDHQLSLNEMDLNNPLQRQHFDMIFGFNESSVFDFPVVNGVREFVTDDDELVIVGESLANVASTAASHCLPIDHPINHY